MYSQELVDNELGDIKIATLPCWISTFSSSLRSVCTKYLLDNSLYYVESEGILYIGVDN
jgi:hypothetical protein